MTLLQETKLVTIGGKTIRVKVLTSDKDKARGYQFQKEVPGENQGLLFVFNQPSNHRFHMRNVYFDLDLLAFDAQGRFLSSQFMKAAQGSTRAKGIAHRHYETPKECMYVIECQPGWGKHLQRGITQFRF